MMRRPIPNRQRDALAARSSISSAKDVDLRAVQLQDGAARAEEGGHLGLATVEGAAKGGRALAIAGLKVGATIEERLGHRYIAAPGRHVQGSAALYALGRADAGSGLDQ
jgi:hypothetical protein